MPSGDVATLPPEPVPIPPTTQNLEPLQAIFTTLDVVCPDPQALALKLDWYVHDAPSDEVAILPLAAPTQNIVPFEVMQ
jgi:hypothetical protein